MNKSELISMVSEEINIPKAQADKAVNAVLNLITDALISGETVRLVGFGSFSVTERVARKAKSVSTGEMIEIPASKRVVFKQGKPLKRVLNR